MRYMGARGELSENGGAVGMTNRNTESRRVYRDLLPLIPSGEFRAADFIGKIDDATPSRISGQLMHMERRGLLLSRRVKEKRRHGHGEKHEIKIYRRSASFPGARA